jgi:hypothetical protein
MAKRVSFNDLDPDDIMNFSLDFEIDLPEVDDAFYEEVVRRESMASSAGESVQSEDPDDEDNNENTNDTDQNRIKDTASDKNSHVVEEMDSSESSDEQVDDDIFNSSSSSSSGSFYDIDDMSFALVPFDALEP